MAKGKGTGSCKHTGVVAGVPQRMPWNHFGIEPCRDNCCWNAASFFDENSIACLDYRPGAVNRNSSNLPEKNVHLKDAHNYKFRAYCCRGAIPAGAEVIKILPFNRRGYSGCRHL